MKTNDWICAPINPTKWGFTLQPRRRRLLQDELPPQMLHMINGLHIEGLPIGSWDGNHVSGPAAFQEDVTTMQPEELFQIYCTLGSLASVFPFY